MLILTSESIARGRHPTQDAHCLKLMLIYYYIVLDIKSVVLSCATLPKVITVFNVLADSGGAGQCLSLGLGVLILTASAVWR